MSGVLLHDVQTLKGVGPQTARKLNQLGIHTVGDILEHYPRSYEEYLFVSAIDQLPLDYPVIFNATVSKIKESRPHRGLHILTVVVSDDSGSVRLVWFNQPYLKKRFQPDAPVLVFGKTADKGRANSLAVEIQHPEVKLVAAVPSEKVEMPGEILPVYSLGAGISQNQFRTFVQEAIKLNDTDADSLAVSLIQKYSLIDRISAIKQIHSPASMDELAAARQRLAFEELYFFQCMLLAMKKQLFSAMGIQHQADGPKVRSLESKLPFELTKDQMRSLNEIKQDMESNRPMQRLLQGDVGAGKTILAAIALVKSVENGYQGALMAPTTILAEQHYSSLQTLLTAVGVRMALLTGDLSAPKRREILAQIAAGAVDIVIGTQALIQTGVSFKQLGLVVADEQHRFGVRQRALLQAKGNCPDVLIMTATPIPRTMALTLYGDLDVSVIRQLPPNRKRVATYTRTDKERSRVYDFVASQLAAGRQAYVVCPLVDESEEIISRSVVQVFEELQETVFAAFRCGLIHGKLTNREKETAMTEFFSGDIQLLIATTVIEVGVNVPNATVMVVENADRFGLAQLHQLRGRVGRGEHQSYCILLSDNKQDDARQRLHLMTQTNDGFDLAEKDLILRGPGHFFGALQHGLSELRVANLLQDVQLLKLTRQAAQETLGNLPTLLADMPLRLQKIFVSDWVR